VLSAATYRLHLRISEGALQRGLEEARRHPARRDVGLAYYEYASALALAHAGLEQSDAAVKWIDTSGIGLQSMESRVLNAWTGAIGALSSAGGGSETDTLDRAMALTKASGNRHALVLAYRAFPPLLNALIAGGYEEDLAELVSRAQDAALAKSVGLTIRADTTRASGALLTKREREVHELLRRGLSNREIARTLFIGEATTKAHLRHVYAKLGVTSRTQAALIDLD
jgi:DNA-binding CsgD family transcriptional regulator